MIEEVMNKQDANFVVILSEAYGLKRVIMKIYFKIDLGHDAIHDVLRYVADNYYMYIDTGVRMDFARVICDAAIGGKEL